MKYSDTLFSVFNGLVPVIVIVLLILTRSSYVSQDEFDQTKGQLFKRLDNVEGLMHRIINNNSANFSEKSGPMTSSVVFNKLY